MARIVRLPWHLRGHKSDVEAVLRASFGEHAQARCTPHKDWWAVVRSDNTLVAVANVEAGVLWDLCVAPAARRRGVATRLLQSIVKRYADLRLFIDTWDLAPFYQDRNFDVDQRPGVARPARAVACMVRRKEA